MTKRQAKTGLKRRERAIQIAAGVLSAAAVLLGLWYIRQFDINTPSIEFRDIHGLAFSADGSQLIVPAHDGFRIFENGRWSIPALPANDYMGYSGVNDGFYSSGHPGPNNTGLINPLGLIRSRDAGQTVTTLAFSGESDFHLMAVGYENHAIYVLNPAPNSRLGTGLYYSLDDGQTWQQSQMAGLSASPIQIAVHPTEAGTVALATEAGPFLSTDYGQNFHLVADFRPVTAVSFDPNGSVLVFGYQSVQTYNLESMGLRLNFSLNLESDDAISYIAINPLNDELAFASFNKDIYLSANNGQSWQQIVRQGLGQS